MHGLDLREITLRRLKEYGIAELDNAAFLPTLESTCELVQSKNAVAQRILALQCVVAIAFSPSRRQLVSEWANRWGLASAFTATELAFLRGEDHLLPQFQWSVEAVFMLLWATGRTPSCSPIDLCPNDLVKLLPSIARGESPEAFVESTTLVHAPEVPNYLDLYYVLHWLQRQSAISGQILRLAVEPSVVPYRRWALEWLVTIETPWDDISLDT